jgi:prepilin-type N-terminal cleavage/methylation domain-containing protein
MMIRRDGIAGKQGGFTLIELVMVIAIIGVVSATGAYLMLYLIQHSIYLPNQMNVAMIGDEILNTVIEGNGQAKGLRFTTAVSSAGSSSVGFTNADGQNVVFTWDSGAKKITASIDGGAAATIPYYLPSAIYVEQKDAVPIFAYYDGNEAATATASEVRRVQMEFRVRSGSGSFQDWQSQTDFASSVSTRRLQ